MINVVTEKMQSITVQYKIRKAAPITTTLYSSVKKEAKGNGQKPAAIAKGG